jgi:hypothetical protein
MSFRTYLDWRRQRQSHVHADELLAMGPIDVVGRAELTLAEGYSPLELERAGLTIEKARELGLPVDPARTTGVGANVLRLRRQLAAR